MGGERVYVIQYVCRDRYERVYDFVRVCEMSRYERINGADFDVNGKLRCSEG